jgi:cytochrome oxidase Cu insertion factor (SCO1/SenC/PrrC family)
MNLTWARVLTVTLAVFSAAIASVSAGNDLPRGSDYDYEPPVPGSYTLPVVKIAPDGAILDSDGKPSNLHDLTHGRVTVLSFIYTRCAAPKACPYATGVLNELHLLSVDDQTLAKNMRLVSMSFDPDYDTPQRLAAYSEWVREKKIGLRMALRDGEVARGVRIYSRRVWSGRGQKARPDRSPRSALPYPARLSHRSRRPHPEHLQFRYARLSPCPRRCENAVAGRNTSFETIRLRGAARRAD